MADAGASKEEKRGDGPQALGCARVVVAKEGLAVGPPSGVEERAEETRLAFPCSQYIYCDYGTRG